VTDNRIVLKLVCQNEEENYIEVRILDESLAKTVFQILVGALTAADCEVKVRR